jgi:YggT family protein
MGPLITAIQLVSTVLTIVVIADILLSWFLHPFHPLRQSLDSIVQPMLAPIRRIMPPVGMFDLSPLILLILIRVVEQLLIQILIRVA